MNQHIPGALKTIDAAMARLVHLTGSAERRFHADNLEAAAQFAALRERIDGVMYAALPAVAAGVLHIYRTLDELEAIVDAD